MRDNIKELRGQDIRSTIGVNVEIPKKRKRSSNRDSVSQMLQCRSKELRSGNHKKAVRESKAYVV